MTEEALLTIRDLQVEFHTDEGVHPAVCGIDLEVRRGEVLALVGESGSGKSVTATSVMGLLPRTARVSGEVVLGDTVITDADERRLNRVRGSDVAMVFQEPMTALNPSMTIRDQIAEAILNHREVGRSRARAEAVELLDRVGIPDASRRARGYPHQLSGGQRQRVVVAIALACDPQLIIADEPTTALDVTVQAEILDLLRALVRDSETALLLVTHNMGVVADIADRVAVMYRGELVEVGAVREVLRAPRADYSRRLLDAVPRLPDTGTSAAVAAEEGRSTTPVLELDDVSVTYRVEGQPFQALDHVSLHIDAGESVGLVGESGSGKSTLGRAALGLAPMSSGSLALFGRPIRPRLFTGRSERRLRARVGVVFQDPGSSLDPRMTIGESIAEPLVVHGWQGRRATSAARSNRVGELLEAVELPRDYVNRVPHELSGGQRQRVGLARALALDPLLIIADEPTSALDVSVQAAVLNVLRELQGRFGFACLFISHDLAVVHSMSHRVAVMLAGRIVETGPSDSVLVKPSHDYSKRLLASVPVPDPEVQATRREARERIVAAVRA